MVMKIFLISQKICTMASRVQRKSLLQKDITEYLEVNEKNSKDIDLDDADIVVIHDPQPLAIKHFYKNSRAKWVWRCHIDISKTRSSPVEVLKEIYRGI